MIPANPKFYDLAGCLNKFGCVYWRQCHTSHSTQQAQEQGGNDCFNFQTGDIIYIYVTTPECRIKYKCVVEGHDLPFSEENIIDKEFFVNPEDFEVSKQYKRLMKMRLVSSTTSDKLTLMHLLENGMKGAPQGSINLSHGSYAELLNYVDSNF